MLKIYHNPRCSKSRLALEYLKGKGVDFEVVEYLKEGLVEEDLKEVILKTNLAPIDLVRTNEDVYKKELKGKNFTDEEWIDIIIENPKLLHRPIVLGSQKAVIARPAEKVDEVVK